MHIKFRMLHAIYGLNISRNKFGIHEIRNKNGLIEEIALLGSFTYCKVLGVSAS
jgi:hypothetical protein